MSYSRKEKKILDKYFTNTSSNIFALVNLPEVIKGTLFSRYSRSSKDLRRLFLNEFVNVSKLKKIISTSSNSNSLDVKKAEDFYERILIGYGDDSVAELGGAHLAIEGVSCLSVKYIQDHRIGFSPLEKSSRYVYFDQKKNGKYQYYRDKKIIRSPFGTLYDETCILLFDTYSRIVRGIQPILKEVYPGDENDVAYRFSIRAKACDISRGLLPISAFTNMGMFGNGRAFEYVINDLLDHPLEECREIGSKMIKNLRYVIPSFVKRALNEKGIANRSYCNRRDKVVGKFVRDLKVIDEAKSRTVVRLIDWDKKAEEKIISAILFSNGGISYSKARKVAQSMSNRKKGELLKLFTIYRKFRHHKVGREFEEPYFSFEVASDWGVYKDLMRHRMLTRHQHLFTNELGCFIPEEIIGTKYEKLYRDAQEKAEVTYKKLKKRFPVEAQYVVTHGAINRFYMKMNLREAVHLTELRSGPQGHQRYREVAQQIAHLITLEYPRLGRLAFKFVDNNQYQLERLESFKKVAKKASENDVEVFKDE